MKWKLYNKITYLYNAAGQKLKKTVFYSDSIKIVDYLDGFQTEFRGSRTPKKRRSHEISNSEQYAGGVLQFFPHPEGYVKATPLSLGENITGYAYNYVYNYTDHLDERKQSTALFEVCERSSVRVSYTKDPQTNQLKILEENHYYPFGLKHSVYSQGKRDFRISSLDPGNIGETVIESVTQTDYQYKYQGQERQDELGLNWDSFKWRNYDYAIGRFMSIDPLADKYSYNSPYAFQENKMGMGVELEGLELKRLQKGINDLMNATATFVNENLLNPKREMDLQSNNSRTRLEAQADRSQINSMSTKQAYEGGTEALKGGIHLTGSTMEDFGDALTWVGYGAAPFTEGTSLVLVPFGEGVSATGTLMVSVVEYSDDGVTPKLIGTAVINLGSNGAGKVIKNLSDKGALGTGNEKIISENILKASLEANTYAAEKANEKQNSKESNENNNEEKKTDN